MFNRAGLMQAACFNCPVHIIDCLGLSLSKIVNLLPSASVNSRIGLPFLVLDTIDSTNNYAMGQLHAGLAKHGQTYFAFNQFAGKGQRGKTWNASPGENITMSIVLSPFFSK